MLLEAHFQIAFHLYMILLIWKNTTPNIIDQGFGAYEDYCTISQLSNNTID